MGAEKFFTQTSFPKVKKNGKSNFNLILKSGLG